MKFIKLIVDTEKHEVVWINASKIIFISTIENQTYVSCGKDFVYVKETPEEIMEMIK